MSDATSSLEALVAERLATVRERIAAQGVDPALVRIVAVTKTFGQEAVRAALAAGIADIGENYPNELAEKAAVLGSAPDGPRWHFIGQIQRRAIAKVAPVVAVWSGVDRVEEGEAIATKRPGARVLVEVDTTGIEGRGGVAPDRAASLVAALRERGLDVAGLMTIAPSGDADAARATFVQVAALVGELGLEVVSMGMSEDFELAVACGANEIRLGRSLFGARVQGDAVPN